MIHKGLKAQIHEAKIIEKQLMPLINLIFEENNPAGIKAVLQYLDLCNDIVRLPLVPASDRLKSKISQAFKTLYQSSDS